MAAAQRRHHEDGRGQCRIRVWLRVPNTISTCFYGTRNLKFRALGLGPCGPFNATAQSPPHPVCALFTRQSLRLNEGLQC